MQARQDRQNDIRGLVEVKRLQEADADIGDRERKALQHRIGRPGQSVDAMHHRRADLARLCGLQRSTISLIVEQLINESWVIEGPTGRLPRGRRPTFLRLNDDRVIVGVDIRPEQTTVALADANGKFTSREVITTPSDPKSAVDELLEVGK